MPLARPVTACIPKRRRSEPCRAAIPSRTSLAEGIVSGHPDMPIFVFSAADVEAIIEYLNSIQEKPEPPQPAQ
jgi:hypothetical protein